MKSSAIHYYRCAAVALLLTLLAAVMPQAVQSQTLLDSGYNITGRISPNGSIRNAGFCTLGFFDKDGTIRNKSNNLVGRIKDRQFFDASGKRLGYMNIDGSVRDGESNVLGYISRSDGRVTNASKNTIGYARGVRMDWIACWFFFHYFK